MAVIDVYQNQAQVGTPASSVSSVRPDMSGQLAVAKANAALTDTVVNGGQKLYEQIAVADVMKANNDYNIQMNKLQNELLQNKEENARDNLTKYEEGRKKIINNIMQKGPSTLRGVLGSKAFFNTIDRDWTGQRAQMERYTMGEMEKYQDTQLNLQADTSLKNIAANWHDDSVIDAELRRGDFMIKSRYANYGEERVQYAKNKFGGLAVGTAAMAAMGEEDYDRAGAIVQKYGYLMNAEDRIKIDKAVNARKKSNMQLQSFDSLYDKYDGDYEKAAAEYRQTFGGNADINKGMEWFHSIEGQQRGANQCANTVSEYIDAAGGDEQLKSSLADGVYRNAEQRGYTFNDRSQLRDGDLVFFQVDGSGYTASDDPNDVENGLKTNKAYKGITHVGVYDAKSGMVIQSGTHGVGKMALDGQGWRAVGYSHIGGKRMDETELNENISKLQSYFATKDARKRMAKDKAFDNFSSQAVRMFESGMPIEEALAQADSFGGTDLKMREMARNAIKTAYSWANNVDIFGRSGSGGAGGKGLAMGQKEKLTELLEGGYFRDKEEFGDFVRGYGPNKSEYDSLLTAYDNFRDGKGVYSYNWGNIESIVKAGTGLKGEYAQMQWVGAQDAGKEFIRNYMAKNGVTPSDGEVIQACLDSFTKQTVATYTRPGWLWGTNEYAVEASPSDLARAGIKTDGITPIGGGLYKVEMKDGRIFSMSGEDLKNRINNGQ